MRVIAQLRRRTCPDQDDEIDYVSTGMSVGYVCMVLKDTIWDGLWLGCW